MTKTTVLIIDAGGRGSALVDKYAQSPVVDEIIAIPGNDLMQINTAKPVLTFPNLKTTSKEEILKIAKDHQVSLVDVAQDNAVEAGVSDLLKENNFKVFGPSKSAGQIEWDKAFSREILNKTSAPQPEFKVFESEQSGIDFINSEPEKPRFIKAFGLAEGKGALPAKTKQEAIEKIKELQKFGDAGKKYLIEDWLIGEEFSAFALCLEEDFQVIGYAQDHKRALDGDQGENTGGMGCSTPPLVVTDEIKAQSEKIISETLTALKDSGRPYSGILYFGGIVVEGKVYVIEFNARWGDPEVECILPGIKNDWFEVALSVAEGSLPKINHDGKSRIVVAAASKGYPGDYSKVKGKEIQGLDELIKTPGIKVYGAGVRIEKDSYTANGGRLFFVVTEGNDVKQARNTAYQALKTVSIPNKEENLLHYRIDIGFRDVDRL